MPDRSRFAVGSVSPPPTLSHFPQRFRQRSLIPARRILEASRWIAEERRIAQHFDSVDEYIAQFPAEMQDVLQEVRRRCRAAVPASGEMISYGIPTVTLGGKYVVYFAGWAHHVSVYPVLAGDDAFQDDIAPFRAGKGTLKFPLGKPIPYGLIERTAELLAAERRGQ